MGSRLILVPATAVWLPAPPLYAEITRSQCPELLVQAEAMQDEVRAIMVAMQETLSTLRAPTDDPSNEAAVLTNLTFAAWVQLERQTETSWAAFKRELVDVCGHLH